ncbi:MAG: ArsR family transcriptional regulator [Actinobacteria bacterium]|nr:MAG: ArsR family transcriptional regulator [Actinomycetota bacterium]
MHCREAEVFQAFSDKTRLKIIKLLKNKGPLGVNELSKALGITPSAVSQHLKALRYVGIVRNRRQGYFLPYELDHANMLHCKQLLSEICSCGCLGSCREHQGKEQGSKNLELLTRREEVLKNELKELKKKIKTLQSKEV